MYRTKNFQSWSIHARPLTRPTGGAITYRDHSKHAWVQYLCSSSPASTIGEVGQMVADSKRSVEKWSLRDHLLAFFCRLVFCYILMVAIKFQLSNKVLRFYTLLIPLLQ